MHTELGLYIEKKRRASSMTQKKLAEALNIKQAHYSMLIHGKRSFSPQLIKTLSHIFKCPTPKLLNLEGIHSTEKVTNEKQRKNHKEQQQAIGKLIEFYRKKKGYTQTKLSSKLGLKQAHYSMLIHGKRPINKAIIPIISRILDIPKESLNLSEDNRYQKTLAKNLQQLSKLSKEKVARYAKELLEKEKNKP